MADFDVGTPILEAPVAEGAKDQHMVLNMGPQHPSTHGVLRLVLEVDGEIIVRLYPEIGYLHTGIEKTCEAKFYQQVVPLTDRVDYLGPMDVHRADQVELAPDLAGHARDGYWSADGVPLHVSRARGHSADF